MDDLTKLLKLAEQERDKRSRSQGRIEGLKKTLRQKGYKGEIHAKNELRKLRIQLKKDKTTFNSKIALFRKRYAKKLSETN